MIKEKAELLVAALRSGDYRQGREKLRTADGFCCLGVACDLFKKETGGGEWHKRLDGVFYFNFDSESDEYYLIPAVRNWFGFKHRNPKAAGVRLSEMNDASKPFSEIADFIETNWESL